MSHTRAHTMKCPVLGLFVCVALPGLPFSLLLNPTCSLPICYPLILLVCLFPGAIFVSLSQSCVYVLFVLSTEFSSLNLFMRWSCITH